MPEVIDNFAHERVAQDIYDNVTNSFSLREYESICCYDSRLDRNSVFDYKAKVELLFSKYFGSKKSKQHLYINSFLSGASVLGLHEPNRSNVLHRLSGERVTRTKEEGGWTKHFLFLICPSKQRSGGDFYFRKLKLESGQVHNSHFNKVDFRHNRLVISDPKKERLMSYIESAERPMVHINLLTSDE